MATKYHAITKAGETQVVDSREAAQQWLDAKETPGQVSDYPSHWTANGEHRTVRHSWTLSNKDA
jgi:hypothetical protein